MIDISDYGPLDDVRITGTLYSPRGLRVHNHRCIIHGINKERNLMKVWPYLQGVTTQLEFSDGYGATQFIRTYDIEAISLAEHGSFGGSMLAAFYSAGDEVLLTGTLDCGRSVSKFWCTIEDVRKGSSRLKVRPVMAIDSQVKGLDQDRLYGRWYDLKAIEKLWAEMEEAA